jgi:hypothetical protein
LRDERRVGREGVAVVSLLLPDRLCSVGIIQLYSCCGDGG